MSPRPLALFGLALLTGAPASFGQAEGDGGPVWGSVYLAAGTFMDDRLHLFQGDLAKLVPGSVFDAQAMEGYRFRNELPTPNGVFTLGVGVHPFANADRVGPEIRIGLVSTGELGVHARMDRTTRVPYDTLVSGQSGGQLLLDSVGTSEYRIGHWYRMFGAQGSVIWRTRSRCSLYGGVGLAFGMLYDAKTLVRHRMRISIEGEGYSVALDEQGDAAGDAEGTAYRNGAGSWWQWHIPLGVDYRVHRSHDLWGRVHLYYEIVPQMLFAQRPVLGGTAGLGLQALFGVRLKM